MYKIILATALFSCNSYLKNINKGFTEDRIFYSIASDNFDLFKLYFEKLEDKNIKDQFGNSLLHVALKYDRNNFIEYLLNKGLNTLSINDDGQFPESLAKSTIVKEKLKKIRLFEELTNALSKSNLKLLQVLTKKEELKSFKKEDKLINLLDFYLKQVNKTKQYNEEILNFIVSKYPELINGFEDNSSPLHTALELYEDSKELFIGAIRVLVNKGANLLKEDKYKTTSLETILKSKDQNLLNLIKTVSLDKLNLVKRYIDSCINELKVDISKKENKILINIDEKDYYHLIGSFIKADEGYLEERRETVKLIITTLALKDKNYNISSTSVKLEDKSRNRELFSGHELINLQAWRVILENDIIYGEYYDKNSLVNDKEYFLDKVSRINDEAEGKSNKNGPFFKNITTAKYAKSQLQKLFQIIHHKENDSDYMNKLTYTVNTLLESVNHCSAKVLESVNHCIVYSLGNSNNKNLESWIEIRVLQAKEEILDNILKNKGYFTQEQLIASTHIKMFIEKELGILPKNIIDAQFTDRRMIEIIGDNLQKIKNDFKKDFNQKLIEDILNQKSEKAIDKFVDYFDASIGANFMGDLGEAIYSQEGPMQVKKEALLALLYINNYINVYENK